MLARGADPARSSTPMRARCSRSSAPCTTRRHVGEALHEARTAVESRRADEELLVPRSASSHCPPPRRRRSAGGRGARAAIEHPDAARRPYGTSPHRRRWRSSTRAPGGALRARSRRPALKERAGSVRRAPAGAQALLADAVAAVLEGRLSGAHRTARQAAAARSPGASGRRGRCSSWRASSSARPPTRGRGGARARRGAARRGPRRGRPAGARLRAARRARRSRRHVGARGRAAVAGRVRGPAAAAASDRERDGRALYLSANTIKSHIRVIYRKLGVHRARTPSRARSRSGCSTTSARRQRRISASNSSAATGRPNCQPWPNPQPRRSTRSRCPAVRRPRR